MRQIQMKTISLIYHLEEIRTLSPEAITGRPEARVAGRPSALACSALPAAPIISLQLQVEDQDELAAAGNLVNQLQMAFNTTLKI
jgi:hypothetical protein